jgi:hypothetical protein
MDIVLVHGRYPRRRTMGITRDHQFAGCSATIVAVFVLASTVLQISAASGQSPITYNIVDYPSLQEDYSTGIGTWTVNGTIETDGTLGPISTENILGGSLTLTGPGGTYTQNSIGGWGEWGGVALIASTTDLEVPIGANFSIGSFCTAFPQQSVQVLWWNTSPQQMLQHSGPPEYAVVYGTTSTPFAFLTQYPGQVDSALNGPNGWIIATVPEPSSLILTCIAAISFLAYRRRRAE